MKMKTEIIHSTEASYVESFVYDTYGVNIEIAAMEEAGDDQVFRFNIDGVLDQWDQEQVNAILDGGWANYATQAMLNYMAKAGKIPTGIYLVTCVS